MDFTRKRVVGRQQKTYRVWLSDDGQYRIIWRSEVGGIPVKAGYHSMVRSVNHDGYEFWSFATARRPFKTMALAVEACEKNKRLWDAFIKLADTERKGRADRVRALDAKATIGSGAAAHKVMSILPAWVKAQAKPFMLRLLYPTRRRGEDEECESEEAHNDPTNLLTSSGSCAPIGHTENACEANGPAELAKGAGVSMTQPTNRTPSKGTSSATESTAQPAKARAKVRKPKSKRPTKRRSKSTVNA